MELKYRTGEIWLCKFADGLEPLEILEIAGGFVRHKHGWESATVWHSRAQTKLGTVRRFLGVRFGVKR